MRMRIQQIFFPSVLLGASLFSSSCGEGKSDGAESKVKEEKPNIELSGNFTSSAQETVTLHYLPASGEVLVDSAKLDENGNFKFEKLHIPGPGFYSLKIDRQNFCPLILNPDEKVKITGDAKNLGYTYIAEGSKDTRIFQDITEMSIAHKTRVDSLGADFQQKMGTKKLSEAAFKELSDKYEGVFMKYNEAFSKELIKVVDANPNSLACITAVAQLDPDAYVSVYTKLDDALMKAYADYPKITTFHDQVAKYRTLSVGSVAPEINMQDPQGNTITLSSLRGKIVMIDFWASWCKPCRKENPNVVAMYKRLKGKGLEILGVSLDENKDEWVKAIANDELGWKHVCDFGAWGSAAGKAYDVTSIPFTVIVDKEGRIASKGLRGAALEARLKELLK